MSQYLLTLSCSSHTSTENVCFPRCHGSSHDFNSRSDGELHQPCKVSFCDIFPPTAPIVFETNRKSSMRFALDAAERAAVRPHHSHCFCRDVVTAVLQHALSLPPPHPVELFSAASRCYLALGTSPHLMPVHHSSNCSRVLQLTTSRSFVSLKACRLSA
jgi:hypothetical protein